jgi:hypothetical protein
MWFYTPAAHTSSWLSECLVKTQGELYLYSSHNPTLAFTVHSTDLTGEVAAVLEGPPVTKKQ